jgi:hypothetical protein
MARKVFGNGSIIRAKITFTDPDTKVVLDPSAVSVVVRTPAGVTTSYVYGVAAEVVKQSVGVYYVLITLSTAGTWKWKWTGTASQKSVVVYNEVDCEKEAGF